MKILIINAGSSSLKYQLIDMENESVVAKGLVEAGVECKLVRVPFENHTMDVPTDNAACQAWAQLSRSWFESHS